jgi:hypothetical protein
MANVIGSGAPVLVVAAASWPDPCAAASSASTEPPKVIVSALSPVAAALLVRVENLLAKHDSGLSLTDLRTTLDVPTDDLRCALEAGIRAKAIRRSGSHNTLRYLVNRRG